MYGRWLYCLVLIAGILLGGAAQASPVSTGFLGEVTQLTFDPDDPFGGTIQPGTFLTGSYTFESATTDTIPGPLVGSYISTGPLYGLVVDIGGNPFAIHGGLTISVIDSPAGGLDQFTVLAQSGTSGGLNPFLSVELFFVDPTGTAFTSDALPLGLPALEHFPIRTVLLEAVEDRAGIVYQYEIQATVVPEPSTMVFVVTGLLGFIGGGWWQRYLTQTR